MMRAQIKGPKHARVLHFRQFRHFWHADDFQHFRHVDAIIAPVGSRSFGLAVFGRQGRVGRWRNEFIKIEFHHFQLIGSGLKQYIVWDMLPPKNVWRVQDVSHNE